MLLSAARAAGVNTICFVVPLKSLKPITLSWITAVAASARHRVSVNSNATTSTSEGLSLTRATEFFTTRLKAMLFAPSWPQRKSAKSTMPVPS